MFDNCLSSVLLTDVLTFSLSLAEKYRRACQWQVVCVSMQWVHDSVDAGYCLDEDDYDMSGKQDGGKPAKQTSSDAAASDWSKELDEFVVPSSSVGCSFLDGCKVSYAVLFCVTVHDVLCHVIPCVPLSFAKASCHS